jgi:hypothetical protein
MFIKSRKSCSDYYTPNETIAGLEFDYTPEAGMPLVADMSSSILSREIDVSKYGVIYIYYPSYLCKYSHHNNAEPQQSPSLTNAQYGRNLL